MQRFRRVHRVEKKKLDAFAWPTIRIKDRPVATIGQHKEIEIETIYPEAHFEKVGNCVECENHKFDIKNK